MRNCLWCCSPFSLTTCSFRTLTRVTGEDTEKKKRRAGREGGKEKKIREGRKEGRKKGRKEGRNKERKKERKKETKKEKRKEERKKEERKERRKNERKKETKKERKTERKEERNEERKKGRKKETKKERRKERKKETKKEWKKKGRRERKNERKKERKQQRMKGKKKERKKKKEKKKEKKREKKKRVKLYTVYNLEILCEPSDQRKIKPIVSSNSRQRQEDQLQPLRSNAWTWLSRSWALFQTAGPSTRIVTFLGCVSDFWPVDQNCHVLGLCFRLLASRPLSYTCKNIRVLRNRVEGAWRYCNDGVYVVTKPCLVYSFG